MKARFKQRYTVCNLYETTPKWNNIWYNLEKKHPETMALI